MYRVYKAQGKRNKLQSGFYRESKSCVEDMKEAS